MESTPKPLRVLLVDSDRFFREGLRRTLDAGGISVVGELADCSEAPAMARELRPDVLVIDRGMRDSSGIRTVAQIVSGHPQMHVVVLGVSKQEDDILEVLAAGACSYLLKDAPVEDLAACVRLAASGHAMLSRAIVRSLALKASSREQEVHERRIAVADLTAHLTARELDVVRLIAQGADNASIGRELSISGHTVKQHVTRVFNKLGVQNRVQAAVSAVRAGLV